MQRHSAATTAGFVLLVVAVVAIIYYGRYSEALNERAATQLEEIQQRLDFGDQAGAEADLELYLERFGGTRSASEARVALAQVTADLGNAEAAAEILEPVARDINDPLGAQAAVLLAAIFEDAGNLEGSDWSAPAACRQSTTRLSSSRRPEGRGPAPEAVG